MSRHLPLPNASRSTHLPVSYAGLPRPRCTASHSAMSSSCTCCEASRLDFTYCWSPAPMATPPCLLGAGLVRHQRPQCLQTPTALQYRSLSYLRWAMIPHAVTAEARPPARSGCKYHAKCTVHCVALQGTTWWVSSQGPYAFIMKFGKRKAYAAACPWASARAETTVGRHR